MEKLSSWWEVFKKASVPMLDQVAAYLPKIIGAFFILLLGWLVARLLKSGFIHLLRVVNRFLDRAVPKMLTTRPRLPERFIQAIGEVLFWLVILVFLRFANLVLGVTLMTDLLDRAVFYMPTFLSGGFIIVLGILFSAMARDLAVRAAVSAGLSQDRLLGWVAQWATLVTTIIIGLAQIGIDVSFLADLILIILGTFLAGLALAFGLGARTLVSNLIGSHQLQKQYGTGQAVRFGETEGVIMEVTPISIILATDEGRLTVPAKRFVEDISLLRIAEDKDD